MLTVSPTFSAFVFPYYNLLLMLSLRPILYPPPLPPTSALYCTRSYCVGAQLTLSWFPILPPSAL